MLENWKFCPTETRRAFSSILQLALAVPWCKAQNTNIKIHLKNDTG